MSSISLDSNQISLNSSLTSENNHLIHPNYDYQQIKSNLSIIKQYPIKTNDFFPLSICQLPNKNFVITFGWPTVAIRITNPNFEFIGELEKSNNDFPIDITSNRNGEIFLILNNTIFKYDSNGKLLENFTLIDLTKFNKLTSIKCDHNDRVIVSTCKESSILIFSSDGILIHSFLTSVQSISSLAINSRNDILLSDNGRCQISIYDENGKLLLEFGSLGRQLGQFIEDDLDWGIKLAVDHSDKIIVSDNGNRRIQFFERDSTPIDCFGSHGFEIGNFNQPYGICIDFDGKIVICDSTNNRIIVIDPNLI